MDDGAVREAVRGAGDDISRGIDGKGANRGAAPVDARFGDEDCGEAGVGGGKVGSGIAQEPAGGGSVTRPQDDRASRSGRGSSEGDGAGRAGNGDPIAGGERFVFVGGGAGVDPEDLIGGAERETGRGARASADDQVAREGHRVEGNLAPRYSCVPVKRAAIDIGDEGETATHTSGWEFGVGVAAGIGDAGAKVGIGGDRTSIGNHGRQPNGV